MHNLTVDVQQKQPIKIEDTKQHVGPLDSQRKPRTEESTSTNYYANFTGRSSMITKCFHLKYHIKYHINRGLC